MHWYEKITNKLLNERAMYKIIHNMLTFIYAYKTALEKIQKKLVTMGTYFGGLRWAETEWL